jgi:hypothetical protein
MADCQNCGKELPPGVGFCPNCGANIEGQAAPPPQQPTGTPPPPPPPGQQAAPPTQQRMGTPPPPPPPGQAGQQPYAPMAPPPVSGKKGMSRGLKIGLIVAACVVALGIVAIVLGVVFVISVVTGPADTANNYTRALNNGEIALAYSYLSSATKASETLAGFREKEKDVKGAIKKYNTSNIEVRTGGTARVLMQLTLTDGSRVDWDMQLVKENDKWKVQAVAPRAP